MRRVAQGGRTQAKGAVAEEANTDLTVLELARLMHAVFEVGKTEIKLLSYYAAGSSRRGESTLA
jgi:hypothetical protein